MQPRKGKTAIQKPLCRLCECPTSDGHVLASQVDRLKLRKWAMKVMNLTEEDENLPEVVGEDALICYFCIWQAEFGDESGDEAVAWWPKKLDLDKNAKVLRENYSVGDVEQCWVQLEEVDLAKYAKEIPWKRTYGRGVCFYCGKRCNNLSQHVRQRHKEAIKCGIRGCGTYFHTKEEKEQHMIEDLHEKRNKTCEKKKILCKICKNFKTFSTNQLWRYHMNRKHPELPVACAHYGCIDYFKTKSEMILHVNSVHKQAINQVLFQCKHCVYITTFHSSLRKHEEWRHKPKIFKCDRCDKKFGSKKLVNIHYKQYHTFYRCTSCGQDVTHAYKQYHRKPSVCSKCELSFECLGLNQLHWKSCKQTARFSCKECEKTYSSKRKLNCHVNKVHSKSVIYRCDHCVQIKYYDKNSIMVHMQSKHFPKTIKCDECERLYSTEYFLKVHKNMWHKYVRCAECAQEIRRQNMPIHRTSKTCRRCECKFKCSGLFEKHKKSCGETALFSCKVCGKAFNKRCNLNTHLRRVNHKSVIFRCDHCNFSTLNKNLMERHIQSNHIP
ncbi:Hypothetical predicted protein [Cloeon dipterum]|uniref:C2H2-type domain-containing protein n=1 Tax=Cloeon dipterum TaxID=197152 RepID=A0A8S1D9V8_9INSE|nr:Hypothetical predicted protein [Cloeon dipterum]